MTQRRLRGSIERSLGSGCDAAVLERQFREEFGKQIEYLGSGCDAAELERQFGGGVNLRSGCDAAGFEGQVREQK